MSDTPTKDESAVEPLAIEAARIGLYVDELEALCANGAKDLQRLGNDSTDMAERTQATDALAQSIDQA